MKMPEHDQAVTVADELLGLGMRVLEELADVVEVLECLPRAAVGSALRQRLGEDERGVGREAVQERRIPLLEEPVTLADVVDVLFAQAPRHKTHSRPSTQKGAVPLRAPLGNPDIYRSPTDVLRDGVRTSGFAPTIAEYALGTGVRGS